MVDVIDQERRIEGTEIRRPVRHFGHGHEGHVQRAGLQLLKHLGLIAKLLGREHGQAVRAAALFGQFGAEGLGCLGPDMGRRGDEAEAEILCPGSRHRKGHGDTGRARKRPDAECHDRLPGFCRLAAVRG